MPSPWALSHSRGVPIESAVAPPPTDRKVDRMRKFREFEDPRRIPRALVDSPSTGNILRRWCGANLGEEENAVASRYQSPGPWKDLPQDLVDYIISMLANDLHSLKACSLACKFTFASARRVIHRRIYLTSEKNWELLTLPEKQRYIRGDRQEIAIKALSAVAEQGLLPYARHLFINFSRNFTPENLQPFNHHFQRFDQIQELSIYWLDTPGFLKNFGIYFANFVPTLRSLRLDAPTGDARDILYFVCRFPHLDDLSFKIEQTPHSWETWKPEPLPVVKSVPPFRGRLKLDGISGSRGCLMQQLSSLPGKRRFRSIDFQRCSPEALQPIIDACSDTLESVSATWWGFGEC